MLLRMGVMMPQLKDEVVLAVCDYDQVVLGVWGRAVERGAVEWVR